MLNLGGFPMLVQITWTIILLDSSLSSLQIKYSFQSDVFYFYVTNSGENITVMNPSIGIIYWPCHVSVSVIMSSSATLFPTLTNLVKSLGCPLITKY